MFHEKSRFEHSYLLTLATPDTRRRYYYYRLLRHKGSTQKKNAQNIETIKHEKTKILRLRRLKMNSGSLQYAQSNTIIVVHARICFL